jgi:hypothetical protein
LPSLKKTHSQHRSLFESITCGQLLASGVCYIISGVLCPLYDEFLHPAPTDAAPSALSPIRGKKASHNSLSHGLLARCLVFEDESPEAFETLLAQHIERYQPADPAEFGFIEEMVAAAWRMRRAWAIETHMLDTNAPDPSNVPPVDRMSTAFQSLANTAALPLMHRYETRLHMLYQRALHNLLLVRAAVPNEPSPISEQTTLLVGPACPEANMTKSS